MVGVKEGDQKQKDDKTCSYSNSTQNVTEFEVCMEVPEASLLLCTKMYSTK